MEQVMTVDLVTEIRRRRAEFEQYLSLLHRERDVDGYCAACRSFDQEMAMVVPELVDEIERLRHTRLVPLTADQVAAALHEGHAERRVAEGDNAWSSIVRQRDQLRAALAEALDGWGAALAKTDAYDEKAFDRIAELTKLRKP